jgi:hypothetical protein
MMQLLRVPKLRPIGFALVGAITGAATAAACIRLLLGRVEAPALGGYCFGVLPVIRGECFGVDAALYLFPGLLFGSVFGPLLCRSPRKAALYAAAAVIANAAAVFLCVFLLHPIDDVLAHGNWTLEVAIAGAPAGATGGGLLGAALRRLDRSARPLAMAAVGTVLGPLAALIVAFQKPGAVAFYILWQAGYAAVTAAASQPEA